MSITTRNYSAILGEGNAHLIARFVYHARIAWRNKQASRLNYDKAAESYWRNESVVWMKAARACKGYVVLSSKLCGL